MALEHNFTGFEFGDFGELRYGSAASLGLNSIVSGSARSGNFHLRQTVNSASATLSYFPAGTIVGTSGTVVSGNHKRVSVRAYVKIVSTTNNGQQRVLGFGDDTGTCSVFYGAQNVGGFTQSGAKIGLRIGSQSHNQGTAGAYPWGTVDLTTGVWYRFLLDIDLDVQATTVLSATLRVTEDSDAPSVDFTLTNSTNIGATDNIDKFSLGYSTVAGAFGKQVTVDYDDIVYIGASNADAASQPTQPTQTHIYAIVPPTGLALSTGWSGSYTDVNEYPIDIADTMSSSTALADVEFTHASAIALGFSSITAMKLYVNALVSGAGTGAVNYMLAGVAKSVTLGTNYEGVANASADPVGGVSWSTLTAAAFSATTFGLQKQNGTQATVIANIGLEVIATLAAAGGNGGTQIRGETQIKEGSIYDAQIAADAAIQRSKIQNLVFPVFFEADGGGGEDPPVIPGPAGATGATGTSGATYSGQVLLAELTASASATLDFATRNVAGQSGTLFQSDYDQYIVEIIGLVPATDNTDLMLRVSTDAGASYDSGANYARALRNDNASFNAVAGANSGLTSVILAGGVDTTTTQGSVDLSLKFYGPLSATLYKFLSIHGAFHSNDGSYYALTGHGLYLSATAVNAFRLLMSSGNISSGVVRVYGLTKTPTSLQNAPAHGLVLLGEQIASASAQLDFVSRNVGSLSGAIFQSDYDEYWFEFVNVVPATNGTTLSMRASTNGGSSYDSGNNYRHGFTFSGSQNTGGTSGSNSEASVPFAGTASSTASGGGCNGTFKVFNPLSASQQKIVVYNSGFLSNDGNYYHIHGSGVYNQTTAVNAMRFLFSSGNITSGTIRCYGVIKGVTYPVSTIETGTFASRPSAGNAGRVYLPSNGFSIARDSGTSFDPWGPIFPLTKPSDASFAWVNQGGSASTGDKDAIYLTAPATTGVSWRIRKKSIGAGTRLEIAFLPNFLGSGTQGGIVLRESGTGKLATIALGDSLVAAVQHWSSATGTSTNDVASIALSMRELVWFAVSISGANLLYHVSADGQNWIQVGSVAKTTQFTTAPDEWGFAINSGQTTFDTALTLVSFKET